MAYDFDIKFTYVLTDQEGTTSDFRILKDPLTRDDPLIIYEGLFHEALWYLNALELFFFVANNFIYLFNVGKFCLDDVGFIF